MTTAQQITDRLRDAPDLTSGLACPTPGCRGTSGVKYSRHRRGYISRRRKCGRCGLEFTTTERPVGGIPERGLQIALKRLEEWRHHNSDSEGAESGVSKVTPVSH